MYGFGLQTIGCSVLLMMLFFPDTECTTLVLDTEQNLKMAGTNEEDKSVYNYVCHVFSSRYVVHFCKPFSKSWGILGLTLLQAHCYRHKVIWSASDTSISAGVSG